MTKHEELRRELWIKTYVAVAISEKCNDKHTPAFWADRAVEGFDSKFKNDNER